MLWQITSASSSASSLIAKSNQQRAPTKDYEAGFGSLSSQYGQCGNGVYSPTPRKTTQSTKLPSEKTAKVSFAPTQTPASTSRPQKNYEAAFAQLSSSYGFGGGFSPAPSRK